MKISNPLFLIPLLIHGSAFGAGFMPADLPDMVEKVLPSVVNISSTTIENYQGFRMGWEDYMDFWGIPKQRKHTSLGTGFIIDSEGYVLTNRHVVENATEVAVNLRDKRQYQAVIVGMDVKLDLAMLQIRDEKKQVPKNLTPATLADSDQVRIAEPVVAIGNPFGFQHTVTSGIISAKNRTIGVGPLDNFLQTDAGINPGNSGGPLFNLKGEVIGINTLIRSTTGQNAGLGFAIPINDAKAVILPLKKLGRVPRPWLGVLAESLTPQMARYYGLPRQDGVLIYKLVEHGPADRAGIRAGDIVLSADGKKLSETLDLERILARKETQGFVELEIQRARRHLRVKIQLREFPPKLEQSPYGII